MKPFVTIIFILATRLAHTQSFEGTLTYSLDFDLSENFKKMGVTKEMMREKLKAKGSFADSVTVSYKQGNYYKLMISKPRLWSIYTASTNKIYAMQDGEASDVCTVIDASIDLEFTMSGKMPTVTKLDTTVSINGLACSIVRVKWESGTYDYYFNRGTFAVDPNVYSKHVHDGWAEYLKISKSLPVRIVQQVGGMMSITLTLVSSRRHPIDDKLFSIPELVPDKDLNIIKLGNSEVMRIKK